MLDHISHWTKDFLSRPLGLGTTGSATGAWSLLTMLKAIGEYAAPIGVILGVLVAAYSAFLNHQRRRDEREKHAVEMRILEKELESK